MLKENLLNDIGFTDEMKKNYDVLYAAIGEGTEKIAEAYMAEKITICEALDAVRKLDPTVNEYSADLMLVLLCTDFLFEKYKENNVPYECFESTAKNIKIKVDECEKFKGVFGTFVAEYMDPYFRLTRIGFGRLMFDIVPASEEDIAVGDITLPMGSFMARCHIPSGSPLRREDCIKSYKAVYNYCKPHLKNGILPVVCSSWLLHPAIKDLYGEGSNTYQFISDFKLYWWIDTDTFSNAWRVFNMDDTGNPDDFPRETRLQRNIADYLKSGKKLGKGKGIFLFDGENII